MEKTQQHRGLRAFNESYKVINELLPETPHGAWSAWSRLGQRTLVDGTYIKSR